MVIDLTNGTYVSAYIGATFGISEAPCVGLGDVEGVGVVAAMALDPENRIARISAEVKPRDFLPETCGKFMCQGYPRPSKPSNSIMFAFPYSSQITGDGGVHFG